MAAGTIEQFVERALRLYEQEPEELGGSSRLGMYVRRWAGWAETGLQEGAVLPLLTRQSDYGYGRKTGGKGQLTPNAMATV